MVLSVRIGVHPPEQEQPLPHLTRRSLALSLAAAPFAARAAARWEGRAAAPWPLQEVYACVWGGQVVVAGGMAPAGGRIVALDRTGLYDPAADRWREGPRLPAMRHHPVLAAAEDRVFAFGGFMVAPEGEWIATRDSFVLEGDRWTRGPQMPRVQCETVAATLADGVHLVGGRAPAGAANETWRDHADVDTHQVFDPADGRWCTARPCPTARNSAAGAVIDGLLYVAGGRSVRGGNTGALERYDPRRDAWERLRPMPRPAGGLAGASLGGRLYVFGGEGGPGMIADTWSYDPKTDAWSAEPPMSTPRHGLAAASVGGRIYAIGGGVREGTGQVSAVVEALTAG